MALILSPNHEKELFSEQSVIISTLAMGIPLSEPAIVRAVAVDHTRISVSWEPGPFPNGPILSYVLQIKDLTPDGYFALKVLINIFRIYIFFLHMAKFLYHNTGLKMSTFLSYFFPALQGVVCDSRLLLHVEK